MTATHATGAIAMRSELAQNWWAIALRGVLGILFASISRTASTASPTARC